MVVGIEGGERLLGEGQEREQGRTAPPLGEQARLGHQVGAAQPACGGGRVHGPVDGDGHLVGVEPGPGRAQEAPVPHQRIDVGAGQLGGPVIEAGGLLPRGPAVGGRRRRFAPAGGNLPIAERRRRTPVAGQVRQHLVAGAVVGGDRLGDGPVARREGGDAEAGRHGVAHEGVDEPEAPRSVGRLDQSRLDRLVDRLEGDERGFARRRRHQAGVELSPDDRGDLERADAGRRASRQPPADRVSNRGRDRRGIVAGLEVAGQLTQQQRVAAGPLQRRGRDRVGGVDAQESSHRRSVQPVDLEAPRQGEPEQLLHGGAEPGGLVGGARAVGGHDEHRAAQRTSEVHQQPQRPGVGLVHIVDHDEEPTAAGGVVEGAGGRFEPSEAGRLGIVAAVGHQDAAMAEPVEDLAPRPERRGSLLLGAPAPGGRRARRRHALAEHVGEPGLADAGLAAEEDDPGRAGGRLRPPAQQGGHLGVAPDQGPVHGPDGTEPSRDRMTGHRMSGYPDEWLPG